MTKFYEQQAALKHFGVLGMHWGHRKAQSSGGNITDSKLFKATVFNKDTSVFTAKGRAAAKQDFKNTVEKAKAVGSKVTDNKVFKALVFDKNNTTMGVLKKSEIDGLKNTLDKAKQLGIKVTDSKAFKTFLFDKNDTTALIFRKSALQKLKSDVSGISDKAQNLVQQAKKKVSDLPQPKKDAIKLVALAAGTALTTVVAAQATQIAVRAIQQKTYDFVVEDLASAIIKNRMGL